MDNLRHQLISIEAPLHWSRDERCYIHKPLDPPDTSKKDKQMVKVLKSWYKVPYL